MNKFQIPFPFSAIVGQEKMKKALLLNAINPKIGGVLIKGEKGTAKSTAVRSLANLLPEIEVVDDCVFGCNPHDKKEMCESCLNKLKKGENLKTSFRKMNVINLPIGSTEDMVVGTLDIEHAIKKGEKKFELGLLAKAHRNLLYVDEINLLDDYIVDVLLDSAAMGVNVIEREGVSYSHPSSFILVGTMNPEEGEIRPQLLDRFGLCVEIEGINDIDSRVEIIKNRLEYESNPEAFVKKWENKENEIRKSIKRAKQIIHDIKIDQDMLKLIAKICIDMQVDGHRADLVMMKTATTIAAFNNRKEVIENDVKEAAELVLAHRVRRKPFTEQKMDNKKLEETIKKHKEKKQQKSEQTNDQSKTEIPDSSSEVLFEIGKPFKISKNFMEKKDHKERYGSGKRSKNITIRGKYVKAKIPKQKVRDIAFDATIRAAALYQNKRNRNFAINIKKRDIREKIRERKIGNTLLFVVDASGSMGAEARMIATKGAILSLLIDAYQKRDRVGLVAFKGKKAEEILPPTSSIELAKKCLQTLPIGGKTPLSHGLLKGYEILKKEMRLNKNIIPKLILISDGKANVSIGYDKPLEEAKEIALKIKKIGIKSIVIDTEKGFIDFGYAKKISDELNAEYINLDELKPENIVDSLRF